MSSRLQALTVDAIEQVPHYRRRYAAGTAFHELGLLSRRDVAGSERTFLRDDADQEHLVQVETSGTSGTPLNLWQAPSERSAAALALWRERRRHAPILPDDPYCRFYGYTREDKGRFDFDTIAVRRNVMQLSMFATRPSDLDTYIDAIQGHEPTWFQAMPSLMRLLADRILERGVEMPASLALIELTGELLLSTDRQKIQAAFPRASIADRYAASEVWGIGYSCLHGRMHVMESNVYVEVLPGGDGTSRGELAVTSYNFRSMPLLRYRLGDQVSLTFDSCDCGRSTAVIEGIEGRSIEFAVGIGGEMVYPAYFNVVVAKCNWLEPTSVARFQVLQEPETLEFRVEPGPRWSQRSEMYLRAQLELKFPSDEINIVLGQLPRHTGRKFRVFQRVDGIDAGRS